MQVKLGWLVVFLLKMSSPCCKENPRCPDPPQYIVCSTKFVPKPPANRIDYNNGKLTSLETCVRLAGFCLSELMVLAI